LSKVLDEAIDPEHVQLGSLADPAT